MITEDSCHVSRILGPCRRLQAPTLEQGSGTGKKPPRGSSDSAILEVVLRNHSSYGLRIYVHTCSEDNNNGNNINKDNNRSTNEDSSSNHNDKVNSSTDVNDGNNTSSNCGTYFHSGTLTISSRPTPGEGLKDLKLWESYILKSALHGTRKPKLFLA